MNICPAECAAMDFGSALDFSRDGWIVEEKFDGIRALVHVGPDVTITGRRCDALGFFQRLEKGEGLIAADWHESLHGCVFDGELMPDGSFQCFDLPVTDTIDIRDESLLFRKKLLLSMADFLPESVRLVRSFATVSKLGNFGEGIVWKRLGAKYGCDWFKAKRVVTFDLRVIAVLPNGVAEVEGAGKIQGVPSDVKPGDVIEVEAFQRNTSGKLRSGRFIRLRDDK